MATKKSRLLNFFACSNVRGWNISWVIQDVGPIAAMIGRIRRQCRVNSSTTDSECLPPIRWTTLKAQQEATLAVFGLDTSDPVCTPLESLRITFGSPTWRVRLFQLPSQWLRDLEGRRLYRGAIESHRIGIGPFYSRFVRLRQVAPNEPWDQQCKKM